MVDPNYVQPGQQETQQNAQVPPAAPTPAKAAPKSTSGLAIAGLVLGIVAILTSFLPIVNNASFFIALIGLILAIAGLVGINKGKHTGKGIAVAGIVLGIVSIAVVLATQAFFSAALDSMSNNLKSGQAPAATQAASTPSAAASSAAASGQGAGQSDVDYQNLPVGTTIDLKSGLSVTVNSIEGGIANYDGSELVCVSITYVNNGTKNGSFNPYDWKAEDDSGALRTQAFYMNAENSLNSGQLSAGGQVTGNIYFDAPVSKVHYYGNIMNESSTAAWAA